MAGRKIRVAHYINQFFGGVGGEDAAGHEVEIREGSVGPGAALDKALADRGEVVLTIVCGDNYFHEQTESVLKTVLPALRKANVDVLIAGPAFNSGRYGLACGNLCRAVHDELKLPVVTGMHPENPGVEQFRRHVYIVPTGASAAGMAKALPQLADFAARLAEGQTPDSPGSDGYIPKGFRRNILREQPGSERALNMLLNKLNGEAFESEIAVRSYDPVEPAPPIKDMSHAVVAIVSEAGIVPIGNPDRIEWARATKWRKYSIAGVSDLTGADYEAVHGGFDNTWANEDPDRLLAVDVLREMEADGTIGDLLDDYYMTVGNGTGVDVMEKMTEEIAVDLRKVGADCAIVPAT